MPLGMRHRHCHLLLGYWVGLHKGPLPRREEELDSEILRTLLDLHGSFCTKRIDRIGLERSFAMPKKRFSPEQIVTLLRQIEVTMGQGKSAQIACREAGISEQSYYRWRKEYGGLDLDQARRMKDLEKENGRLKRLVADLSLEKQVLKDIASGNL